MFYKLPRGRTPTLCPYFLPIVCVVRGIIFPGSKAAGTTVTSLTPQHWKHTDEEDGGMDRSDLLALSNCAGCVGWSEDEVEVAVGSMYPG